MNLSEYKSDKETNLVIYNKKLYKASRYYDTLLYLNDYFKKEYRYKHDINVNDDELVLTVTSVLHNSEVKKKLYEDFKKNAIWLKDDLESATIYKIHLYLLQTVYQHSYTSLNSEESILAREYVYKTNILEIYDSLIDTISENLYKAVSNGKHAITLDFRLSDYSLTKDYMTKLNLNLKNSDGVVRNTLETYIPYLLRDMIPEYDDTLAKEQLSLVLKNRLQVKFPHLIIKMVKPYNFEISFMEFDTLML